MDKGWEVAPARTACRAHPSAAPPPARSWGRRARCAWRGRPCRGRRPAARGRASPWWRAPPGRPRASAPAAAPGYIWCARACIHMYIYTYMYEYMCVNACMCKCVNVCAANPLESANERGGRPLSARGPFASGRPYAGSGPLLGSAGRRGAWRTSPGDARRRHVVGLRLPLDDLLASVDELRLHRLVLVGERLF